MATPQPPQYKIWQMIKTYNSWPLSHSWEIFFKQVVTQQELHPASIAICLSEWFTILYKTPGRSHLSTALLYTEAILGKKRNFPLLNLFSSPTLKKGMDEDFRATDDSLWEALQEANHCQ